MPDTPSVRQLIEDWQAGGNREEIFRDLFERYSRPIAHFFKSRGFQAEECRELTQETFLGVYRGLGDFRLESSFETWLFRIARNIWKNNLRYRSREKRAGHEVSLATGYPETAEPTEIGEHHVLVAEAGGPLEDVLADESVSLLRDAVRRLSPLQRRLLNLRFAQELKVREIASVLRVPDGTVKSQLSRACQQLRKELGDLYPELDL